jgi:hypothetical protein
VNPAGAETQEMEITATAMGLVWFLCGICHLALDSASAAFLVQRFFIINWTQLSCVELMGINILDYLHWLI